MNCGSSDLPVAACRLVDKKNARRYDDCILYSLISAKKARHLSFHAILLKSVAAVVGSPASTFV
jgi:hypothetical protein